MEDDIIIILYLKHLTNSVLNYVLFSHLGNPLLNPPEIVHTLVDEPESLYPELHEKVATVPTGQNLKIIQYGHTSSPLLKLTWPFDINDDGSSVRQPTTKLFTLKKIT